MKINGKKKIKKKNNSIGIEGIRVGLKAFIMTYVLAFIISLVINLSIIENIQGYLQGTLVEGVGFNFGLMIKTAALVMNISVFNASGTFRIGLLVLVVLPFFAFYLADRSDNKEEGMDLIGLIIYFIASGTFTFMLVILSAISKGDFLGVDVNFVSVRNVLMTFIITFLIQIAIGMNYDVHRLPGVLATRWMVRLTLGFSFIAAIIGLVFGLTKLGMDPMSTLLVVLVLAPNIAVYMVFTMMGISVEFNTELLQLMNYGQIEVSYSAIPIGVRIGLMAFFVIAIFISIYKIDQSSYFKGLLAFSILYPLVCLLAAMCTTVDLGTVKFIGSIRFGIGYVEAVTYPFIGIIALGAFDIAINRLFRIIKS